MRERDGHNYPHPDRQPDTPATPEYADALAYDPAAGTLNDLQGMPVFRLYESEAGEMEWQRVLSEVRVVLVHL